MVYTAPNEDTVVVVGGLGTQANKAQLNGGGATKAVWDANSPSDFINTNGGPKRTASCAFTTATKNLNGTDIGNGVIAGTLCYVSAGDGAHITAGVYEITTVTDNDNIICAQIDDDGTNDTGATVNVGGALDGLQNALDNPVNNGALHNRYIYDNYAESVGTQIDADQYAGTSRTRIFIIGYNSDLTSEDYITLTATANITSILKITAPATIHEIRNIDFYGGGKDAANKATYGLYAALLGDGDYSNIYNCKMRGCGSDGMAWYGRTPLILNCEMYLNGRHGYDSIGAVGVLVFANNSIHDNDETGVECRFGSGTIMNNFVYSNGKDEGTGHGFHEFSAASRSRFIGNTVYDNYGNGFNINSGSYDRVMFNNTCVGNGGYGFDFNGLEIGEIKFFGYNHSSVNTSGHYSEGADNTFADFANGNNKADTTAATDIFTSVTPGSEDFTPKTGTDLIDNALDAGTA